MTAPSIEMIAASLRGCSLTRGGGGGGGGEASPRPSSSHSSSPATPSPPRQFNQYDHLAEGSDEGGGVTVDLNSETALPYYWEQRLDLRTGELYYINWQTGVRTTEDPRTSAAASGTAGVYQSTYCYSVNDEDDDDDETSLDEDEDSSSDIVGYGGGEYEDTADSSSISTPSPPAGAPSDPTETFSGQVLVAAGCKSCFMYFMVPKRVDACPKCGGGLLHLGRNGCI